MDFKLKMMFSRVFLGLTVIEIITVCGAPVPGKSNHIHHRIHVPQQIKTIYHTKIIKVPEHHHHFHEKEKIIIQKEEKQEHFEPPILIEDEKQDWHGWESSSVKRYVRPSAHAPKPKIVKKRRVVVRPRYSKEEEDD